MSSINFPSNPYEGQKYNFNGVEYEWQNGRWISGGATFYATRDVATQTEDGLMSSEDKVKLDGIDSGAGDMTGAEIKALYEAEPDTNAFTDAEQTKLAGIESGATAGPGSDAEVKAAYERNADTNAFTDAEQAKLAGIEAGAQANVGTDLSTAYYTGGVQIRSSTGTNALIGDVAPAGGFNPDNDSGLMTATDKSKLDGIEDGAQVNVGTDLTGVPTAVGYGIASSTGTDVAIPAVVAGSPNAGLMTPTDKDKLDGIDAGAQANAVITVNGMVGNVVLVPSDIGLGSVDNTADADKPVSTAQQTALDAKADLVEGKVPTSQLPAIAVSEYLGEAANEAAMLSLVGQTGDWCSRTDLSSTWIITGSDPSQLSSWTEMSYPPAQSVPSTAKPVWSY